MLRGPLLLLDGVRTSRTGELGKGDRDKGEELERVELGDVGGEAVDQASTIYTKYVGVTSSVNECSVCVAGVKVRPNRASTYSTRHEIE